MNEDALGVFRKYELTECTPKLILLLITWVLEEKQQKFDPYYMRICDFLYDKGEKNKVTLSYLLNYYMGDTKKLLDFYKAAEKNGVEIRDGALERLLGQALFTGADLLAFEEPFEEYKDFKKMDIGDIVGLEGEVFKTKTGEISIHASAVKLLST